MDITFFKNFNYINEEFLFKKFMNLHNMDDILKWCKENEHQPKSYIIFILNFGMKYYLDSAKYLQNELTNFLYKNKDKFNFNEYSKDDIYKIINTYIEKNIDIADKDTIPLLFITTIDKNILSILS